MAAIDKTASAGIELHHSESLLAEIVSVWREFILAAFDPYRPERHYMRGPGPACRRKTQDLAR